MPTPLLPLEIHKLEKGKLYSDLRDRDDNEPKPAEHIEPVCPEDFTEAERKEWDFFASILRNYGLLHVANATQLELLSVNMVLYRDALAKVRKHGLITVSKKNGAPCYNPYFNAKSRLEQEIQKSLEALGLSSQALARLGSLSARAKQKKKGIEELMD